MKRLAITTCMISLVIILKAQDCPPYYPMHTGDSYEMSNYNAKGKLESTMTMTVLEGDGNSAEILTQNKNEKDDLVSEVQFEVRCTEDGILVDMASMAPSSNMNQYEGMEVNISGDQLDIPANGKAGDKLEGGKMEFQILNNGVPLMTMEYYITHRKIDGFEDVECPLGTFKCMKISYDMEFRGILSTTMKTINWFSPETGIVKTATYNKKGKLQSYSLRSK